MSHAGDILLVPKAVTLNDLERRRVQNKNAIVYGVKSLTGV